MRPQGVIRVALREAATRLAEERGGASWREIASAATLKVDGFLSVGGEREQRGVAPSVARQTIKDMVRAGELTCVGREKPAGSNHWHQLYVPVERSPAPQPATDAARSLGELLTTWSRCGV